MGTVTEARLSGSPRWAGSGVPRSEAGRTGKGAAAHDPVSDGRGRLLLGQDDGSEDLTDSAFSCCWVTCAPAHGPLTSYLPLCTSPAVHLSISEGIRLPPLR